MGRYAWAGALCALGALAGCEIITELPPAQPPNPPQGPPAQLPPGVAKGEPQGLAPGSGLGLWIWLQDDGTWRLRSVTDGGRHHFRGRVVGQSSPINWIGSPLVEGGDAMTHDGRELVFNFETVGHLDGIDFTAGDRGCVVVQATVDETAQPSLIHLGAAGTSPPSEYFTLCP